MNSTKVNISSLTPQEARLYRLYGRVPSPSHYFAKHLKERKYFDSGDYALSKAGRADAVVGSLHPVPQNIPHPHHLISPTSSPNGTSPTGTNKMPPSLSRGGSFSGAESEMVGPMSPTLGPRSSGAGLST